MSTPPLLQPVRDTRKYKSELHGVRGLAISLVVAFHIFGQGRVSGGIDVFLAITGFLALPSLARRSQRGWGGWLIDVPQRLAGLARRLVVPLIPVLLAIAVATLLIAPLARHDEIFREVGAAALFYENWELIFSQLEYGAAGPLASPLQHLWSTSIQGQFHLVMIAFVIALGFLSTRLRRPLKQLLIPALALLTMVSFAWAAHETQVNQARAYFSTFSRAWQLTAPGILGLLVASIALPPLVRGIMSWIGVLLIVTCGMVMDGALYFPGPRALWPVLGVCLVLAAGETHTRWGADRLLETAPFQRIGDISYSLYLWHWPVLIFTMLALGREQVTPLLAVGVLALSLLLGKLGYELFEQRALKTTLLSRRYLPALLGGAAMVLVAAGSAAASAYSLRLINEESLRARERIAAAASDPNYPGSAALIDGIEPAPAPVLPEKDWRNDDLPYEWLPENEARCVSSGDDHEAVTCDVGRGSGPHIVIAGGSHIGQWSDSFIDLADIHGWRITVVERAGCPLTTDAYAKIDGEDRGSRCARWTENALRTVKDLDPDLAILQFTTRLTGSDEPELATSGMLEAIREINDAGIDTFLFRETTNVEGEMANCVATTDEELRDCSEERSHFYSPTYDDVTPEELGLDPKKVWIFDTSPYLCDDEMCFAQVGNVRIHRDNHHITATLSHTITPYIAEQLARFRPDLF
ncbi:MAG: acyltransferase family protein [Flaviflexus sp.]|nr:acyltransferase family protein [Flaviflexus sp.]